VALFWAWDLPALNSDPETKLHNELREVLGAREPAIGDLPRLRYTEAVIKECMRLCPPAWVVGRKA